MRAADEAAVVGSGSDSAEETQAGLDSGAESPRRSASPPPLPPKRRTHPPRRYVSEDEDDDAAAAPSPPPPKKSVRRRLNFDDEGEEVDMVGGREDTPPPLPPKSRKAGAPPAAPRKPSKKPRVEAEDEEGAGEGASGGAEARPPPPRPSSLALRKSFNAILSAEREFQKAMDVAVNILVPLKVDIKHLTMCPDQPTLECFTRGVQAWMSEHKVSPPLLYTTNKTFKTLMARFMLDFCMRRAGVTSDINLSGCYVWRHGSSGERGLHCFHGSAMIAKDQIIEMDLTSENAQRALKDTPERTKVAANRWGRQVVQLTNNDAACCPADVGCSGGNYSAQSCGMFFTEAAKALTAFEQIGAFQQAAYPNMQAPFEAMMAPLKCDCNWGLPDGSPLHGRQLCKLTPFSITGLENIDKSRVEDPKVLASLNNPAVLVFQCCNPVYRGSRSSLAASGGKNCDFKISSTDALTALQTAKKMWCATTGEAAAPVKLQEFKWSPKFQVQNVVLPTGIDDASDTPW